MKLSIKKVGRNTDLFYFCVRCTKFSFQILYHLAVNTNFWQTKIEFLKGLGPGRAGILNRDLNIFTFGELIQYYPFRHEDRSRFYKIAEIKDGMAAVQLRGVISYTEMVGENKSKRLVAYFSDGTGEIELIWFNGAEWMQKMIQTKREFIVYGKPQWFAFKCSIVHPEIDTPEEESKVTGFLRPVYHTTELMKKKGLDSKSLSKVMKVLIEQAENQIEENLPGHFLLNYQLVTKKQAVKHIHFPENENQLQQAKQRLKFEELFYIQLQLLQQKQNKKQQNAGFVFSQLSTLTDFYQKHLPFELTNAQKRVIKEIHKDVTSGRQMNRLLQGDVGSGKTIVAFICMLMAIDNGTQACLMAPTEILAEQHFRSLQELAKLVGVKIGKLTGSTKKKERTILHEQLQNGELQIIVGTHALIEETVQFKKLGFCVIDEQHRFGVEQRAKLWQKNNNDCPPHVLVMTATPIPRTLAMTIYGDLDVSVIDELPPGRKPIRTVHRYDNKRQQINAFVEEEIRKGRQIYWVFPLIEESEKMDYKNLMEGYERIQHWFPHYQLCMVHGKMKPAEKEAEMQRFLNKEAQIMVATTVIEVGVNVPNASVMIIENAERFGLSQLHQLRGRVGRGAEQSFCILMTDYKLSEEGRVRITTMCETNDGFKIADVDMQLRGPGDMMGTKQSGALNLLIANLAEDQLILQEARKAAEYVVEQDLYLQLPENQAISRHIQNLNKNAVNWSRIS